MVAPLNPAQLAKYAARIGLSSLPGATLEGLATLQGHHRKSIGFENLDIALGRAIAIDSASVFTKLVTNRRGGYCFEQNRLFCDVLATLGLNNRPLLGRVHLGQPPGHLPPRTHLLLLVENQGSQWIADAGFGGSFVPPMPLVDGALAQTGDGASHRLRRTGDAGSLAGQWVLERAGPAAATDGRAQNHAGWQAQYSFDLAQVAPMDLVQCNHFTATMPDTRFTTLHLASIVLDNGFASMTDKALTVQQNGKVETSVVGNAQSYRAILSDIFGIEMTRQDAACLPLFAS